ncbi:outer membrane protein OmpA-like peptidoglycan-associated protein/ABC-type nitrate/sulfonate/bicarbonate transport system substrate-binding protein [Haloferula luteola]|uniref:Outer membrane protein OmpA-like peptidoglycan-associated protein/ABC-type nitrate/sulfonate/bicarbonate transport system substrate-binding protein n=1 Tax=Haloferula luteola TaxID=595692 RepID=A0A840VHB3_9BACT|nr:phosphate ABC transporter substrate-binding/OmpA family protein [Haloferula luteola]MBB5353209.1 outer membrane protein OmpA-like peptidoglycan-associated protein/ABC-type nitrate/sulfonate/bicarbonate transport system substrate-binding protein [Haloferula luteola]
MNAATKLAILLFAVCAVIAGAWFALKPMFHEHQQEEARRKAEAFEREISEAKVDSTLRIAGDGYLGYFFASSLETRKLAVRQGVGVEWVDDGGTISDRVEKLASGEYDIIAIPAAEYLVQGQRTGFPGVIAVAIARSNGGDGVLARRDVLTSGNVSDLNDASLKWVYTGGSPSEFLVEITVKDLDFYQLRGADESAGGWRVPVNSSEEVYRRAMNGRGDVFVLWEPDISRALKENPNLTYVWGSDKFAGYIVDYFVVNKRTLAEREGEVLDYFKAYFRALDHYRRNASECIAEMARWGGVSREAVEEIVNQRKIDWIDLSDNCLQQFGIEGVDDAVPAQEGVIDTLLSCADVLADTGKLGTGDLRDPYRLINTSVLQALKNSAPRSLGQSDHGATDFEAMTEAQWAQLREVAKLQVRPVRFRNGTELEVGAAEEIDKIAKLLSVNYPNYRVKIRGHTGGEDTEANRELSKLRAEVVRKRLVLVHGFDEDRLQVEGVGSSEPPEVRPGENPRSRAYRGRVPRVEAILLERGGL